MGIFDPYKLGQHDLLNRVVMSPMTRARSKTGIPNALNAKYYAQRAGVNGAGLIVTEGISISPSSVGVLYIPGLYTAGQVEGWCLVTRAVHEQGAVIYAQLWHVGRVAHVSNHPNKLQPVSSSGVVAAKTFAYAYNEQGDPDFVQVSIPQPLTVDAIEEVVNDYVHAAKNAISAGFDGVEIHGGNGYLIEQFLNPEVNNRDDQYGGSVVNRSRFLLTLIDRIADAIGSHRIGVRLSPYNDLNDMPRYETLEETYYYLAKEISLRNIAYIHFMNRIQADGSDAWPKDFLQQFRALYQGVFLLAGGMTLERSDELLKENSIDLAVFGQSFIANPDLTARLRNNWPLALSDRTTFYGGEEKGYTDYPVYQED